MRTKTGDPIFDKYVEVERDVYEEYTRALLYHEPFHSAHEGYAVIKEELDELWEKVRKCKSFKDRPRGMRKEALQIAAMAIRFIIDMEK